MFSGEGGEKGKGGREREREDKRVTLTNKSAQRVKRMKVKKRVCVSLSRYSSH